MCLFYLNVSVLDIISYADEIIYQILLLIGF